MKDAGKTRISIGIVFSKDHECLLLTRRPNSSHQGGFWEFPGGKLRGSETFEEALVRELREEININMDSSLPFLQFAYDYPDRNLFISARMVDSWSGEPHANEGQQLKWVSTGDVCKLDFPPANEPLIRALQLPEVYFITPDLQNYDHEFMTGIDSLLESGIRMIRFRSANLSGPARMETAVAVRDRCRDYGCRFIYSGDPEDAIRLDADGLHLTARQLGESRQRPLDEGYLVGASCHDSEELSSAAAIKADFCVLAPVFATSSHPHGVPMGWERFSGLAGGTEIPVYALGGLRPDDLRTAREYHARGIAMISGLWNLNM